MRPVPCSEPMTSRAKVRTGARAPARARSLASAQPCMPLPSGAGLSARHDQPRGQWTGEVALVVLLVVLGVVGGLAGCKERPPEPAAALQVTIFRVARRDVALVLEASGPLRPLPGADVKLGTLVAGRVRSVPVADGDVVSAGELLLQIDPAAVADALAQSQAQLVQTRAQATNATGRLERARKLFEAGVAARQEVDDAEAQATAAESAVRGAAAAVNTARGQVGRTELRAPFAGRVAHVSVAPGEPVDGSGKTLVEVAKTDSLEVHAEVSPESAARLTVGMKAQVTLSGNARRWPATLQAVAPLVDGATGTLTVRVRLENGDGALRGGALAQVSIVLEVHPQVLAVPEVALVPLRQSTASSELDADVDGGISPFAVETVDAEGKARRRAVVLGAREGGFVEIRRGLDEGEPVILQGAYALPDGTAVKPEAAR